MEPAQLDKLEELVDDLLGMLGSVSSSDETELQSQGDVAVVRAQTWYVLRSLKQAQEALSEQRRQYDREIAHQKAQDMTFANIVAEIEYLKHYEARHEQLELVSLEEFLADNPDVVISQLSERELMSERLRDEERRRTELFSERTKLRDEVSGLQQINERYRKGGLPQAERRRLNYAVESLENLRGIFKAELKNT